MASPPRCNANREGLSRPKVSICIPSYNNGNLIGHAIKSALDQTFDDIEVVVVDNCSTDDSERAVRSFGDNRVRFSKNNKNIGMTRNWNKCISMAHGEFVSLLCADDMHLAEFAERAASMLEAHPNLGFVYCAYRVIDGSGETTSEFKVQADDSVDQGPVFFNKIIHGNFVTISGVMIRRACLEELGCFDETLAYAPDWELLARISLHYDVGYLSEPLACYRFHEGNFTYSFKKSNRIIHEVFKTIDRICSDWEEVRPRDSEPLNSSALKSEYVTGLLGVRLDCSSAGALRKSITEEISKNRRNVMDLRLGIPFIVSYLGIRIAVAFLYPSKMANTIVVRILNKVDRLI